MLHILKLLLPAILPSWNFFDIIAPSPRIQYALLNADNSILSDWREFKPRPVHVPFRQMLYRMFWNPEWNETLFMMSCAERIMEQPTEHSELEILQRIQKELRQDVLNNNLNNVSNLQFRLELIQRQGDKIEKTICFYSRVISLQKYRDSK